MGAIRTVLLSFELNPEGLLTKIEKILLLTTVEQSNVSEELAPIAIREAKYVRYCKEKYVTLSPISAFVAEKIKFFDQNTNTGQDDIGEKISILDRSGINTTQI